MEIYTSTYTSAHVLVHLWIYLLHTYLTHPQVQASDPGADGDGVIKYHVSDTDNFKVDEEGVLYNIRPLDYERTSGQYRVQISAESQGELKNRFKNCKVLDSRRWTGSCVEGVSLRRT